MATSTPRPGDPSRAALAVGFTLYRSVNGGASAAPQLWRSCDRGATWTLVNDQWDPEVLTIDPRDSRILYGADRYSVYTITVPD